MSDRPTMLGRRRRAVVLVANPANPYSRGLRVARSLAEAGFEVEIAARAGEGAPIEERDGEVLIHRYVAQGRWERWAQRPTDPPGLLRKLVIRAHRLLGRLAPPLRRFPAPTLDTLRRILFWPLPPRGWWTALRRELPPADLYHACGILTVGIALELGREARRRGREGRVVYDVIDIILDSNNYRKVPRPLLAFYRWKERRWARRVDAVVTVNDPIADFVGRAWSFRERPTVLLNCQPRWTPIESRPDHIRRAAGLPPDRKVVLFLGRLGRERGLHEAAEAVILLSDAALVLLGFGQWADEMRTLDDDARFAGRHFTLPAVHPDAVPEWASSADVSIIAVPANSMNQRLSSPNKFWESLTAGTPVVIGRDLETMRRIVDAERVGAVANPSDPADLARALREVLDQPAADLEAMRQRCLTMTREHFNWEIAVGPYLELVERLTG